MQDKGQSRELGTPRQAGEFDSFVLDKSIFSNIFEKDIRRVYIYKKAERLAKAIHLVAPAFSNSRALRDRLDKVAVGLVDAAILPPSMARDELSRELLALSSVLSIARSGGLLSPMNAELISREAHLLLQEVASYEAPRLSLEETPTLASLAKEMTSRKTASGKKYSSERATDKSAPGPRKVLAARTQGQSIGQLSDKGNGRRDAILSVLKSKGPSYIKDISTVIRDVSEKTVQRELQTLVEDGRVKRAGERRWTTYSLV